MRDRNNQDWSIVGVLFVTLFFIWGPVNAAGVFFVPVVKHFGWSRAMFSLLVATAPLSAGISSPFLGSLLDRIGARSVMIGGATTVALSYAALSRADSALEFFVVFLVLGIGVASSTVIPASVVLTNRFGEQRGLALGIAFAGMPLGGTGITLLANHVALRYGFRGGYLAMSIPVVLLVIPLLAIFIRTKLDGAESLAANPDEGLVGLEVREALRSRSFWMIAIAEVMFATAGIGLRVHLIPYLTTLGYTPTIAASLFSAMFIFSTIGNFLTGSVADRIGGRVMLASVFLVAAAGISLLLGAVHFGVLALALLVFGLVRETPVVLVPMVVGESLGICRLGSLLGILALFNTFGFAMGPVIAGRIFDVSGRYTGALLLFGTMALFSMLAIRATLPLSEQRARVGRVETAPA